MTLQEFKELCEEWEIDDDTDLEFGCGGKVYKITNFWYVGGNVVFSNREEVATVPSRIDER
jgi:hypothetical protein